MFPVNSSVATKVVRVSTNLRFCSGDINTRRSYKKFQPLSVNLHRDVPTAFYRLSHTLEYVLQRDDSKTITASMPTNSITNYPKRFTFSHQTSNLLQNPLSPLQSIRSYSNWPYPNARPDYSRSSIKIAKLHLSNRHLSTRTIIFLQSFWRSIPDVFKLIAGFVIASYLLVFVALPLLFVGLPLLFIGVFLYTRARSAIATRVTKLYLDHLRTSTMKFSGSLKNLGAIHSLANRRISLAFEYNENGISKILRSVPSKFTDNRPFDSRFKLSKATNIQQQTVDDPQFALLTKFEFVLLQSDYLRPRDFDQKIGIVTLIVGTKAEEDVFDGFEEEQPCIIEIVGGGLSRFIIDKESEFTEGELYRVR